MGIPKHNDSEQEFNLRRLSRAVLIGLWVAIAFVCWWLYTGVGFFRDEMSYSSAYGPRKGRVALPAGTVPRDGMGYDNTQLGLAPLQVTYDRKFALNYYNDFCEFCHGANGQGDTPVGLEYVPRPPDLNQVVGQRTPAQLFEAISNGMTTPSIATTPPIGPRWHEFSLYLNEAERRQLVDYLEHTFGPNMPAARQPPATTITEPRYGILGNPPARGAQ